MPYYDYSYEHCKAFMQQHEELISLIASFFYSPDNYGYHAMVCDLTTHLWNIYRQIPPDTDILDEPAWAYTVLYRKALNLYRDEHRHQSHLVYDADLSNLADDELLNHNIDRLYQLIDRLDNDDKDIVLMYIDKKSSRQIADLLGIKPHNVRRRLAKICDRLRHLDSTVDDDYDYEL